MTLVCTKPWPWPAVKAAGKHPVRLMLDTLSGLPVLGWEASCRFNARGIQTGRMLAGIDREALSASRWSKLFDELGVPAAYRHVVENDLDSASRIYLACEQGSHAVTRKLYLEFAHAARQRPGERLSILGYKWIAGEVASTHGRTTEYWTQEPTDARTAMAALKLRSGPADCRASALLADVLIHALTQAIIMAGSDSAWQHEYIRVSESSTTRASFALNFYGSGLRIDDLTQVVSALVDEWGLNTDEFDLLLDTIGQRELAWLAGGLDAQGEPFLTIYCAASRDDAMQVCFSADSSLGDALFSTAGNNA